MNELERNRKICVKGKDSVRRRKPTPRRRTRRWPDHYPAARPDRPDVQIEILFCGICHSDLHYARDEWHDAMPAVYPCVPGHEIVGRVAEVGSAVTKFKAGDLVGVGCLVDSDRTCPECRSGLEQFCPNMVDIGRRTHGAAPG